MKTKLLTLLVMTYGFLVFSQQAINYKALIKDDTGNVLSNQNVTIQFTILEGAINTNVYEEFHSTNTDLNGIVIVNIGNGTVTNGDYSTINWGDNDHYLNVQIDSGSGLVDLGTTQFMAVPYALYAEASGSDSNATGLEALDEGNGVGWRLIGSNPINYENIGLDAVDLSFSNFSNGHGASGDKSLATGQLTKASGIGSTAMGMQNEASAGASTALGFQTKASGDSSISMGRGTLASGNYSTAMGFQTEASGNSSTALGYETVASGFRATAMGFSTQAIAGSSLSMGVGTIADNYSSIVAGKYNLSDSSILLQIGNGIDNDNRSNALNVFDNGTITAPSFDISEITDPKALITKEYLEANSSAFTGLEAIDQGNGIGWRLKNVDSDGFYPQLGNNSIDISTFLGSQFDGGSPDYSNLVLGDYSFQAGRTNLATGDYSIAMGFLNQASGTYSIAMGIDSRATGQYSIAIGTDAWASGDNSIAFGNSSNSIGINALASGAYSLASGENSTALGYYTNADDPNSTVVGLHNDINDSNTTLFQVGNGTGAFNKSNAFVVELDGRVLAPSLDIAEISNPKSLITKEYLELNGSYSTGLEAIDEGNGFGWRLIGRNPNNFGNIGFNSIDLSSSSGTSELNGAIGNRSFAVGNNSRATALHSIAMGDSASSYNSGSVAIGSFSDAGGANSIALGYHAQALGSYSAAIGYYAIANQNNAFAVGEASIASGPASVAMGAENTASGNSSFAMGDSNVAAGNSSVALGFQTNVTHDYSFAMGNNVNVSSFAAAAFGYDLINDDTRSFLVGQYNDNTTTATSLFMVGNGVSTSNRSNAFTVFQNGNATLAGTFTQNSDRRLKIDIDNISYGLNEVLKLNPVTYHWKKNPNQPKSLGLIAQEVQPIINEIVHVAEDENKTLSVSYTELIPVLIKAIQEQQEIIESQKRTISIQEQTNNEQSNALQTLLNRVEALEKSSLGSKLTIAKN